jgi:capsular exopolysaccharide synthesis family protein
MDPEQTGSSSSERIAVVVRRRALWIVLVFVLVTGATYGYSKREAKKYTATASVSFSPSSLSQQILGLPSTTVGGSSSSVLAQQQTNVELVSLGNTAAKTASLLGHGLTAAEVSSSLHISAKGEANVVEVASTSTSPVLAAAIANTYVRQFVANQRHANRQFLHSALALIRRQLATLSPVQQVGADGLELQEHLHTIGLLEALGYNNVQVAQETAVPTSPSSPKTSRNTVLGAIGGLLLGLAIAVLVDRLDHRVRDSDTLESLYRLPILGAVPKSSAFSRPTEIGGDGAKSLPLVETEAFGLIRARLRFLEVDRDLRTVLIAAPEPDDGATTIACNLACSAARSGSRVMLVEVDMRRPTVARRLGVQAGPGLAEAVAGGVTIDQAIQSVALGDGRHRLDVLTAGEALPPSPGELLESRMMDALLAEIKRSYDLVVIDAPPLNVVSDAVSLLTRVDGVVIVGRVGHSRRDAAEELQKILVDSGARLLGIVVNGLKRSGSNAYLGAKGGRDSGTQPKPPSDATTADDLVQTAKT